MDRLSVSAFPKLGLALVLTLCVCVRAAATPPPPPPREAQASFDAIDRLHVLEGDWEGSEILGGTSIHVPVARRVGRFGAGQDHLLIGSLMGRSDPPSRLPLEGSDIVTNSLDILTFDPVRGGYWLYAPGFFGERQSVGRGHDEQVAVQLIGPAEIVLRQRLSDDRERTIHVRGDSWDETLVRLRPDGPSEPILTAHLSRFPGVTQWGTVSRP